MSRNNRIKRYCERFPSKASRNSLASELRQANEYKALPKWNQRTFMARLRELEGSHKPQSIILKFQRLHRYFEWEISHGFRKSNPIDLSVLPKHRDMRAPQALSNSDVTNLYKVIPSNSFVGLRDRLAISLMLVHGYRISSIVGMNWSDFEYRNSDLYVSTLAKNGVVQSRKIRSDVKGVFEKYQNHIRGKT